MVWSAFDLRAEIDREFDELALGETRGGWFGGAGFRVGFHHRRVWNREPVVCRTCGARFTPLNAHRVYCSTRCHVQYNNHHSASRLTWRAKQAATRLASRTDRVCADPRCHRVFTGNRSDCLYCSSACRERWRAVRYQRRKRGVDETAVRLPGRWGARQLYADARAQIDHRS